MLGAVSFLLQMLLVGPALRRFGLALTILILPMALGIGNTLILLAPAFWSVLVTNALDQGFRFSLDKASYELLYLPLAAGAARGRSRPRSTSSSAAWRMRRAPCCWASRRRALSCFTGWTLDFAGRRR